MPNFQERFLKELEKHGIKVYEGTILNTEQITIGLNNPEDFIKYCNQFDIKAVIMDIIPIEHETNELDRNKIIEKLERWFKKKKSEYPYNYLPQNLPTSYYDDILTTAIDELKRDAVFDEISIQEKNDKEVSEIEYINFKTIHQNCEIHTTLYPDHENDEETEEIKDHTEEEILEKYARMIIEKLQERYNQSKIDSERIKKEKQDLVFQEIKKTIRENPSLKNMHSQRERYQYADRLFAIWFSEKGEDWLFKKDVRSLVDLLYGYATDENQE